MRTLILTVCIFTISMLVSAGNIRSEQLLLNDVNDLVQGIHRIRSTNGGECYYNQDDIVCPIGKGENVSKDEYNKDINEILDWNKRFITKEFQEKGLKGRIIFKEV